MDSSLSSQPPQIIINPARQKMVQKLALYEDGVLDSLQLLSSSSLPGACSPGWGAARGQAPPRDDGSRRACPARLAREVVRAVPHPSPLTS